MDLLGKAIADAYKGNRAPLRSHSSLGDTEEMDAAYFLRSCTALPALEQRALREARGRVLDIGCGAGSHLLCLQDRGMVCMGIDRSAGAAEVARQRGVRDVRCADIREIRDAQVGKFGTLLLLMNGIGLAGNCAGLASLLRHLGTLLEPHGQILLDSSDLIYLFEADSDGGIWVPGDRAYYGEITYRWEYRGEMGEPFDWLFASFGVLRQEAARAGFLAECLEEGDHYDYLARLRPRHTRTAKGPF